MNYFYPLLLYLGLGGGLLLLGVSSFPRLGSLRKPISAVWVTAMAFVWLLAPSTGRWVLSAWSPSHVAGGLMVLDMHPSIWWSVLLIFVSAAGGLWVTVSERADDLPLTGMLLVVLLTVSWASLAAGSLLMTLAAWAVFDVIWFVVRLVAGADGERVVWASALNGVASLVLWAVSLFLLRDGDSGLWWLMRPSSPVLVFLSVAALIRIGFYPFQIGHVESLRRSRPLALMSLMNPVMGVALLYRLSALPGSIGIPGWVVGWGCLSVLWSGVKALGLPGRDGLLPASYGILLAVLTGGVALGNPDHLVVGVGAWLASVSLLIISKRQHAAGFMRFWPAVVALVYLLGVPPSSFMVPFAGVLGSAPWGWRIAYAFGLALATASLLRGIMWRAEGRVQPPSARLRMSLSGGHLLVVIVLIATAVRQEVATIPPVLVAFWFSAVAFGVVLARWGGTLRAIWGKVRPLVQLLDLQWLYRAVWQGAENLLGTLRVTAEVVEGSGSVLWSVLILMLVLMVLGSR